MLPRIALLSLLAFASIANAQDPLKSPECTAALAQLESARAANSPNVETVRRAASNACFGVPAASARPSRSVQAPIRVPPPVIEVKPRAPLPPIPTLPPPVPIERGPTISSCDAAGCWVNNGNRLQHVTPNLMAPYGLCGIAPGAAGCP
ncbi:hypothetical protein [Ramlibacter albus]|uniref:Uncharacterized protein n=1 Tax=Ramlibacter albus TaxID=2079448 RepID=A0A923M7L5_9BURK|nr:hypothetical protein [Ramlibacter albus]MBC5764274.1 hypothetical protein [Ramlibacter albus]